jgi:membrane protease YdiL (CAAX protease family)
MSSSPTSSRWSSCSLLGVVRSRGAWQRSSPTACCSVALLPLFRLRSISLSDLGVRRAPGARSVGFAFLALVAIVIIDVAVAAAFTEHGTAGSTFFELSHQRVLIKALAGFAAAVSAPVVEEVFFRGVLYRSLRNRLPVLAAALVAGTMFGLAHAGAYPLGSLPAKAGFGFVMCLLYERTGSLLPCIAVHSFLGGTGGCSSRGCGGTSHFALAGSIVAYQEFQNEEGTFSSAEGHESWQIIVRDLRSGRVVREVPTGTPTPPSPRLIGAGFATEIVVKSDGALAWIVESGVLPSAFEVHAVDWAGSRLLASGSDIDPHSLALSGNTLYWTQGGSALSAFLN